MLPKAKRTELFLGRHSLHLLQATVQATNRLFEQLHSAKVLFTPQIRIRREEHHAACLGLQLCGQIQEGRPDFLAGS